MTKKDFINRQATKLRIKHQFNELTELECKDFVDKAINEALTLYGVSKSLCDKEEHDKDIAYNGYCTKCFKRQ